jgi:hypothetical protein
VFYYIKFFLFFHGCYCEEVHSCDVSEGSSLYSKVCLDSKLIVVSVVVGFLYISVSRCRGFRFMFRSRNLMLPFSSCVGLSFMLLCI